MQTPGWILLPENRAARLAVERVRRRLSADVVGRRDNPLTLHGPPGCGKTRLTEELAAGVSLHAPDRIVRSLPASDFATLEDSPSPSDGRGGRGVRDELRDADLLVVEDVQFLPARTVEAFVQLLDVGLARRQQVVLTASTGPALLADLPARLTSRLSAGLVVALTALSPDSRLTYLRRRIDERGIRVGDDVLNWLAQHGSGSARQLEGALTRVERLSLGRALDVADLQEVFAEEAEARRPTMDRIMHQVGRYFRVEPKHLRSASRSRAVLVPRQVGMYLARQLTGLSLEQIGTYFGRDHTTVLHACRKVEQALPEDATLDGAVRRLWGELESRL